MLTKEEFEVFRELVQAHVINDGSRIELMRALTRSLDTYAPNQGSDVIAKGPDVSSTQMLDEATRALGWRTDFACGDSPITWDLVLAEIRELKNRRVVDVVTCVACNGRLVIKKRDGKRYEGVCIDKGCGVTWTQDK